MDLYNILIKKYKKNNPFSIYDIQNLLKEYSKIRIYQLINELIEEDKLIRYEKGMYYIPSKTMFGNSMLNIQKVIEKKYIKDDNNTIGFLTGLSLLNKLGFTTQVPNVIEIYTNKESSRVREIKIENQRVRLRSPRKEINKNNYNELQFLEILNLLNVDEIDNNKTIIFDYMKVYNVKLNRLYRYINIYPAKVFKNIAKLGSLDEDL